MFDSAPGVCSSGTRHNRLVPAKQPADPPGLSSAELAEFLGASPGSISTANRELIRPALAERVRVPGSRQGYFRATMGANVPQFLRSRMLVALLATAILANRPASAETLAVAAGALRFWKPRASAPGRRAAGAHVHAEAKAMLGPPRGRAVFPLLSVASTLANVSCLFFVLIAAHAYVGYDVAVLAAGAAATAGRIPLLPGGIGVVEVIIPAVVHWYGPPFAAALAGALVYRVLGTFLPAAAGGVALFALRASRHSTRSP